MWESPIELQFGINDMVSEFIKGQTEQTEKYIVESVQSVGIKINKDELIKAINYDRNQYEKGYQDGLNADKWISVDDRLPEESHAVLVYCPERKYIYCAYLEEDQWWIFGAYSALMETVTKWQPLPDMPNKENL